MQILMEQNLSVSRLFPEHGLSPLQLVVKHLSYRWRRPLACSSRDCNSILRQSVSRLHFRSSSALASAGRYLAGRPSVLSQRFPHCKSLSITLQRAEDAAEPAAAILEAAACYKPPLQSLDIEAEGASVSSTLRLASLLLPSLQELHLRGLQFDLATLHTLGQFTSLTNLVLCSSGDNPGLGGGKLSAITALTGLQELSIMPYIHSSSSNEAEQQFSLDFLAAFPHLTSLCLRTNAELHPLALCTNLRSLDLDGSTEWKTGDAPPPVFDYHFLSALTQLTELHIAFWGSLAPLAYCTRLASLDVSKLHPTNAAEIAPTLSPALSHLTSLTQLFISLTSGDDANVGPVLKPYALRPLQQLQELYLDVMHDGHLSALSSCTQLTTVRAGWYSDSFPAMHTHRSKLQPLISIKNLCVDATQSSEPLPPLYLFPSLTELRVIPKVPVHSSRYIPNILRHCQQLTLLHTDVLAVEDILLLQQLPTLCYLWTEVATVPGFAALATLTQLTHLSACGSFGSAEYAAAAAVVADGGGAAAAEAAALEVTGGAAAAAGEAAALATAGAKALFPLLQLRANLKRLHVHGVHPALSPTEAHAFLFGWGKPMRLELDYDYSDEGDTWENMRAAVQAWKETQGVAEVPIVDVAGQRVW